MLFRILFSNVGERDGGAVHAQTGHAARGDGGHRRQYEDIRNHFLEHAAEHTTRRVL